MFVGRERELGFLRTRLAEARSGEGGVVLVEGEAGAGKPAFAPPLSTIARDDGMTRAWGACLEGGGAAPYGPWSRLFRALGLPELDHGSRARLFVETVETLRTAAGPGLLLVIDDLHWADPS